MAYNILLADKVRSYLSQLPSLKIEEKKMFRGLAFLINGKMCINISGDNLMCRFDPELQKELETRTGYLPMLMKDKEYKGYCYVEPCGIKTKKAFEFWINTCLAYNTQAKSSKKKA